VNFSGFFLQNVPPAPGRGEGAPAPQAGQPSQGVPDGGGGAPPSALSGAFPLLLVVPMLLVMFFMNRSQQKRQKELESKLKAGDQVVTQSGLIGKLTERGDKYAKVEIAPGIKVKMLRTAVIGLDTGEEAAKAPASTPTK
jgi:preprotein translocase subunit YajC